MAAEDEYKLSAIIDMLRARMAKRDIPLRCLELGKVEPASKGTVRQTLTILQGIPKEKAKAIVAAIKATKLKVNAQMQDDQVRVSGAKKRRSAGCYPNAESRRLRRRFTIHQYALNWILILPT